MACKRRHSTNSCGFVALLEIPTVSLLLVQHDSSLSHESNCCQLHVASKRRRMILTVSDVRDLRVSKQYVLMLRLLGGGFTVVIGE